MTCRHRWALQTSWFDRSVRLLVQITMLGLLLVLAARGANYLRYATSAVTFPFGLDYGEGIVWQQALLIPGPQMYGNITQFPFVVFHYPPFYHLLVRAIAALGIDPLAAGRGISLAAIIAISILVGGITFTAMQDSASTGARIFGSVVAGLMVFTYRPVQEWAVLMRVDMLAIALSTAGVYLSIVARQRTITLCATVLLFVLAVYTKQTELVGPIAVLLVAAIIDFRSALKAVIFGVIIAGTGLILLLLATDGGFWSHIVEYNLHNRFFIKNIIYQLLRLKPDGLGLLMGIASFAFLWWAETSQYPARDVRTWIAAIRQSKRLRALSIVSLWFALASAQLVTLGKSGSWNNYFIEWMCITAVPIGMAATVAWAAAVPGGKTELLAGLPGLFLSLALAGHALHRLPFEYRIVDDPKATAVRAHLVDLVHENEKPVLSEDMVLLLRAGQPVPIEPAVFAELTYSGTWDQRLFLNLICTHAFGLVIMEGSMEQAQSSDRFTKEVASAIENSYPVVEHSEEYTVRRPAAH
jgi:hypothetical protein